MFIDDVPRGKYLSESPGSVGYDVTVLSIQGSNDQAYGTEKNKGCDTLGNWKEIVKEL